MRANEITIETAKTGKVTTVVTVMSIFSKTKCKLQSANRRNEKLPCQKAARSNFPEKNTRGPRNLSQKSRKGWIPKKLVSKSKNLELNCTNLELNSKKTHSDRAKMPDPSVSSGLKVQLGSCLTLDQVGTSFL
jgi:hypothetical protein